MLKRSFVDRHVRRDRPCHVAETFNLAVVEPVQDLEGDNCFHSVAPTAALARRGEPKYPGQFSALAIEIKSSMLRPVGGGAVL